MRRFLASLSLLAIPVAAVAAYASPSELLLAATFKNKPLDLAYEAHLHVEDIDAAAWIRGSTEGNAESGKADISVTVDLVQANTMNIRAKAKARIVDQTLYVLLESVEGASDNPYALMAGSFAGKQWYSMPLEEIEDEHGIDQEQATEIGMKVVDAVLTMVRTPSGEGSSYSLKFKRTAAADLKKVLDEIAAEHPNLGSDSLSNKDVAELRRVLAKSNVHLKVMTNAQDVPTGMKFYAAYKDGTMEAVLTGTTTLRTAPLTVVAPADALPLGPLDGTSVKSPSSSSSATTNAARTRKVTERPLRRRR